MYMWLSINHRDHRIIECKIIHSFILSSSVTVDFLQWSYKHVVRYLLEPVTQNWMDSSFLYAFQFLFLRTDNNNKKKRDWWIRCVFVHERKTSRLPHIEFQTVRYEHLIWYKTTSVTAVIQLLVVWKCGRVILWQRSRSIPKTKFLHIWQEWFLHFFIG